MKTYRIKTNDFAKLTSNKDLLTNEQKTACEKYENIIGQKAKKVLPHGKDIVLIIGQDNKYYITSKPAYQDSIVKILQSVDIDNDNIIIVNRSSGQSVDLTIEQVKNLLTA
jgi:hypothetical protein